MPSICGYHQAIRTGAAVLLATAGEDEPADFRHVVRHVGGRSEAPISPALTGNH